MKIIKLKQQIYLTRVFVLLLFGLNLLSVAEANNCNSNEFSITGFKFTVNPINTKSPFNFQFSLRNNNQCDGFINVAVAIKDSQNQVISHLYKENIRITFISDVVNVSFKMNTPDKSGTYKIFTKIYNSRNAREFLLKEFSICNKYLNVNDFSIENLKLLDTPIYSYSSFRVRFD